MRVREQNHFYGQVVLRDYFEHRLAIGTGIECDRLLRRRRPNKIRVHHHVVETRRNLSEPIHLHFLRTPFARGAVRKAARAASLRTPATRSSASSSNSPSRKLANFLRTDPRFLGQLRIGQTQPALGFSEHVGKIILQEAIMR